MRSNKLLGQHFLSDEKILAEIANAAELHARDTVLEIGPGRGGLTWELAKRAGRVVAVEKDERLYGTLAKEIKKRGLESIHLIHGDILKQSSEFFAALAPYKIVANIPYYLTGALFKKILSHITPPTMMVVTVQKEVALRLTALPPKMNLLGLSVKAYGEPSIEFTIPRQAFEPPPKVDSAVVSVKNISKDLFRQSGVSEKLFFDVTRRAFQAKRKMIKSALAAHFGIEKGKVEKILKQCAIDPQARPEALTMGDWLSLIHTVEIGEAGDGRLRA